MINTINDQLYQVFKSITGKQISHKKFNDWLAGYLFILVPLLVIGIFKFFPAIYGFFLSLHKWDLMGDPQFVGLQNYINLFQDNVFAISLKNTLFYTVGVVPTQIVLALILAFLVNQSVKFRTFFRASFFLPAVASAVVMSLIFLGLYNKMGIINQFLDTFGFPTYDFMNNKQLALPSIMAMNIYATAGQFMVIYLAGLKDVPEHLYESAEVDGASNWQKFWHITLPMLKPTTFFIAVMSVIGCLKVFTQVEVMTDNGGPVHATKVIVYYIYQNGFQYFKMGYACAASVLLFIVIFTLTLIQRKYFEGDSN